MMFIARDSDKKGSYSDIIYLATHIHHFFSQLAAIQICHELGSTCFSSVCYAEHLFLVI
jgi:hypothetical protein